MIITAENDMAVTSADINALPGNLRRYVMELESTSDASGYVQRIAWLEHENAALQVKIAELKGLAT